MTDQPRIVALVPMRHHSVRVPGKNYRLIAGKPLYQHILETLLACPEITTVVVDTDSPVIVEGVRASFPAVQLLERPEHLRADTVPMNEILMPDTSHYPADFYLQTHSTNPLLRPQTVSRAIQTLITQYPAYDSLFGVTRLQTRLWDALAADQSQPQYSAAHAGPAPVYEENSCLCIFYPSDAGNAPHALATVPGSLKLTRSKPAILTEQHDYPGGYSAPAAPSSRTRRRIARC